MISAQETKNKTKTREPLAPLYQVITSSITCKILNIDEKSSQILTPGDDGVTARVFEIVTAPRDGTESKRHSPPPRPDHGTIEH